MDLESSPSTRKMKKKMKKRCSKNQSDGLFPEQIEFEMLLRLPVKSLFRFRCVSTLWRSIIDGPHFVSAHFAHSSTHPKLLISLGERRWKLGKGSGTFFFCKDYPENSEDLGLVSSYHDRFCSGKSISRSVGGLICIGDEKLLHICNPSTRERVSVRAPSTYYHLIRRYIRRYILGHDPAEKKYMVVSPCWRSFGEPETEITVLTLGKNKWTKIDPGVADLRFFDGLCINGVMHMFCLTGDGTAYCMLFDVRLESFRSIPFPEPAELEYYRNTHLVEFEGRATLLHYRFADTEEDTAGAIRLWILEDVQKQVWSCKEFAMSPRLRDALSDGRYYLAGATHTGELVFAPFVSWESFHCYLYHVKNATLMELEIPGLDECMNSPTRLCYDRVMVCSHVERFQPLWRPS